MHMWDDEWFHANGNDLYDAINFIEDYLRKHHIGVCGKEKYGSYQDEFLRFWNGGLYEILFGYRAYIGTFRTYKFKVDKEKSADNGYWKNRFNNKISPIIVDFVNSIHRFIYNKVDYAIPDIPSDTIVEKYREYYDKRIWKGLIYYNNKLGLTDYIQSKQASVYNKAFQLACKKWPNVIDELICDVCGYKMIKPCKWGDVDGTAIHKKYWKEIN